MNAPVKPQNEWPSSTRPFLSNPPEGSIGIAIPMRDNLKFFKLTFHSILDFTDHRYVMAIVDNMSGFRTSEYLKYTPRNHNVNVLKYQKEHSLAAEANMAFRFMFAFASVKYGILVTPDVVVEPGWASRLIKTLTSDPKVGIVGPMTSHGPVPQRMGREDTTYPAQSVSSFCMAFRRETYESVNGFDEAFMGRGYEDQDFCHRAEKKGWMTVVDASVFIHRFPKTGLKDDMAVVAKNEALFRSRLNGTVAV
jgi:GT2 family glycosyltransferase